MREFQEFDCLSDGALYGDSVEDLCYCAPFQNSGQRLG